VFGYPHFRGLGLTRLRFKGLYLRSPEDAYNPRASPLLYSLEDLKDTAPAYLAVAGRDMLRDEGLEYAKKLQKAGVKTKLRYYHNTIHAFFSLHFCDESNNAMEELSAALFTAFQSPSATL
jgi:acetyl esterase